MITLCFLEFALVDDIWDRRNLSLVVANARIPGGFILMLIDCAIFRFWAILILGIGRVSGCLMFYIPCSHVVRKVIWLYII